MTAIDKGRKRLVFGLSVLLFVVWVYVVIAGSHISAFHKELTHMEDYGQEQADEFLAQIVQQNTDYLAHMGTTWEWFLEFMKNSYYPVDYHHDIFVTAMVEGLTPSWVVFDIFIVTSTSETWRFDIKKHYALEEYGGITYRDIADKDIGVQVKPLCGDTDTPFGEGDRMYWGKQSLIGDKDGLELDIYMGFSEQVLVDAHHHALDVVAMEQIKSRLTSLITMTVIFMGSVMTIGFLLIFGFRDMEALTFERVQEEIFNFEEGDIL